LRNVIVIIYSRGVLQPSGIREFGNEVIQLSPLRPALGDGDRPIEFLRNALAFERVLQSYTRGRDALSSMQKQTQKRPTSGFRIISCTVSTLEGGGSVALPALTHYRSIAYLGP